MTLININRVGVKSILCTIPEPEVTKYQIL